MEAERGARYPHRVYEGKRQWSKMDLGINLSKEGDTIETIHPEFRSSSRLQLEMYDFDDKCKNAVEAMKDKIVAFNANGSGWILTNVHDIFINIAGQKMLKTCFYD